MPGSHPTVSETISESTVGALASAGAGYNLTDTAGSFTLSGTISTSDGDVSIVQISTVAGVVTRTTIGSVQAVGNSWSLDVTTPADGAYQYVAYVTNTLGGALTTYHSSPIALNVVNGTPTVMALQTAATNNITNDPTFDITAASSATSVEVYDSLGDDLGAATATGTNGAGNTTWTFTDTASPDGSVTYDAVATLSGGSTSTSAPVTITLDTTPPASISIGLVDQTGASATSNPQLGGTVTPAFAGQVVTGDIVTIYEDGGATPIGTTVVTVDASGHWSLTPTNAQAALNGGHNTFTARVTDAAGNSVTSSQVTVNFEQQIAPPTLTLANQTGPTATNVETINITTQNTATSVEVFSGTTDLGAATGSGSNWTFTPDLASGTYAITAKATDAAGNSATSGVLNVDYLTSTATPTIGLTHSTGANNYTSNDALQGTATKFDTVSIYETGVAGPVATTVADSNGNWSYTPTDAPGTHTYHVTATDSAGNSATSSDLTVNYETTAPTGMVSLLLGETLSPADAATFHYAVPNVGVGNTFDVTWTDTATGHSVSTGPITEGTSDPSSLSVDLTGLGSSLTSGPVEFVASITVTDQAGNVSTNSDANSITGVICFYPGTMVQTPDGERAVETLAIGDLVLTHEGEARPVRWMGRQTVSTRFADTLRVAPILIRAGALGDNLPVRDLRVSPDHALLVHGVLVQAGALVNGVSIVRDLTTPEVFTYHHVELADHSLILAEGVAAETFVDNIERLAFDNWDEHEALYGHLPPIAEMTLPRAKSARQIPMALRAKLAVAAAA